MAPRRGILFLGVEIFQRGGADELAFRGPGEPLVAVGIVARLAEGIVHHDAHHQVRWPVGGAGGADSRNERVFTSESGCDGWSDFRFGALTPPAAPKPQA